LLASATMERATHDAFTASYGDADLVVDAQGVPIGPEEVAAVRGTDGVATADVQSWFGLEVTGPRATEWVSFSPTPSDPRLAVGVAERLGVEIGDVVPVGFQVYDEATDTQEQRTDRLEVVGLLEASDNFFAMGAGGRLEPEALDAWRTEQNGGDPEFYGTVLVALADGADLESVRADLQSAPGLADASVQTVPELAAERTARETGSNVTFLVVMLGFAAVALSVAGLV